MKYIRNAFILALMVSGCDAVGDPTATITSIDVDVAAPDQFVEIQDVAGRTYTRADSFPAAVDVQLWTDARDLFIIVIRPTDDGLSVVAASDSFKARDLTGTTYTTSGDVQAVFTLE